MTTKPQGPTVGSADLFPQKCALHSKAFCGSRTKYNQGLEFFISLTQGKAVHVFVATVTCSQDHKAGLSTRSVKAQAKVQGLVSSHSITQPGEGSATTSEYAQLKK
jgi:hypothetical protein